MITPQTPREQLLGLQEQQLFDLARNESARWIYRKIAAGLLKEKGLLKANHPEIAHVLSAFLAEIVPVVHESEVSAVVETAQKTEIVAPAAVQVVTKPPVSGGFDAQNTPSIVGSFPILAPNTSYTVSIPESTGPFKASVTTTSLNEPQIIENGQK